MDSEPPPRTTTTTRPTITRVIVTTTTTVPPSAEDALFTDAVRHLLNAYDIGADAARLLGLSICRDLDEGADYVRLANALVRTWSAEAPGGITAAALHVYCPHHAHLLDTPLYVTD